MINVVSSRLDLSDSEDFGDWVAARRRMLGISQADLAATTNLAQPHISAIEHGARPISLATKNRIIAAVNMRPIEILEINRNTILNIFADFDCKNPMVFGSVARGTDTADSDLDFMVQTPDKFSLFEKANLINRLQAALTVPVDIVAANAQLPTARGREWFAAAKNEATPV